MWHHDYLHLRPIARDLEVRIAAWAGDHRPRAVLDLGCGASPYRRHFGAVAAYVRVDLDPAAGPDAVARAEALPFADASFDALVSTQLLQLTGDPGAAAAEVARVVRPGGRVWITVPAGWPQDSDRAEHRFGAPDLVKAFGAMRVIEVARQGGLVALPWAVFNLTVREAVRAAERRVGAIARVLRAPAAVFYILSNAAGRALEGLAARGPAAGLLGYVDARGPQNFLLVAERPS